MSNQDVKIDIKTTADTAGAQAVTKSISQLEKELKDAKDALRSFTGSAQGFEEVKAKAKAAEAQLNQVQKQVGRLGTRNGNSGMAVLELSRGLEDLQYGVRGVLNNIPPLIMQLGGSAGLAGVLSMAAVGASQLWERLGNSKPTEDKLSKFVTDNKALFESLKKTFKEVAAEQKKLAEEDSFKHRREAIDAEKTSMENLNTVIRTNIELNGKLAKIATRDALSEVDQKERQGKLTKPEADSQRLAISISDAKGDIKRQKELNALEVQKAAGLKQAATASRVVAENERDLAIQRKAAQEAEAKSLKAQAKIRESIDLSIANLKPQQEKTYAEGEDAMAKAGLAEAEGYMNKAAVYQEQAEAKFKEAERIWNTIKGLEQRISTEALQPVAALQKKDKDGKDDGPPIDAPIIKRIKILEEGDKATGVESLKKLNDEVIKFTEATQAATLAEAKATAAVEQAKITTAQKDKSVDIDAKDNPALKEFEKKAGESVKALMNEILARIPESAKGPEVDAVVKKIDGLVSSNGGVQQSEKEESTDLLRDLQAKVAMEDGQRAELYQKISENSDAMTAAFNTLNSQLSAQAALNDTNFGLIGTNMTNINTVINRSIANQNSLNSAIDEMNRNMQIFKSNMRADPR